MSSIAGFLGGACLFSFKLLAVGEPMQLRSIMTTPVRSVDPDFSVAAAARTMKEHDIGALAVCRNGRISGVVTDRDIAVRAVASGRDLDEITVDKVMTRGAVVLSDQATIEEAARMMESKGIRRLMVKDEDQNLVGVVSLSDIARRARADGLAGLALHHITEPGLRSRFSLSATNRQRLRRAALPIAVGAGSLVAAVALLSFAWRPASRRLSWRRLPFGPG